MLYEERRKREVLISRLSKEALLRVTSRAQRVTSYSNPDIINPYPFVTEKLLFYVFKNTK